jgi:hypothetical protein
MRVQLTDSTIEIQLARWEKICGLMKDISLPLSDVSDARLIGKPLSEAVGTGLKAGLRLPGFRYVARTIRLDQVFIVRRGVPALSFAVRNHDPLQRVVLSTPEAEVLVKRLGSGARATAAKR